MDRAFHNDGWLVRNANIPFRDIPFREGEQHPSCAVCLGMEPNCSFTFSNDMYECRFPVVCNECFHNRQLENCLRRCPHCRCRRLLCPVEVGNTVEHHRPYLALIRRNWVGGNAFGWVIRIGECIDPPQRIRRFAVRTLLNTVVLVVLGGAVYICVDQHLQRLADNYPRNQCPSGPPQYEVLRQREIELRQRRAARLDRDRPRVHLPLPPDPDEEAAGGFGCSRLLLDNIYSVPATKIF